MGISATADKNDAFVWNGDDDKENYTAAAAGSFNINPRGETIGFYIGNRSLSSIIHDDIEISANAINDTIKIKTDELLAIIDKNSINDKKELSSAYKSYSNEISSKLSTQIDANRSIDSLAANSEAKKYVTELSVSLSNFIDDAHYSIIDKIGFSYDDKSHKITLSAADQLGNEKIFENSS